MKTVSNVWNFQPLKQVLKETSDITWIIKGWLAEGSLTMISGSPKLGKSLLELNIGLAVSQGARFLGMETAKKKVALVSAEDGAPIFQNRIKKMELEPNEDFLIDFGSKFLDQQRNIKSLTEIIKREKIGLLMFDPYIRFHKADENSADAAKAIYMLKDVASETGVGIIIVHHDRKSGGENGNSIRGSSAIFGAIDLAIMLKRKGTENHQVQVSFTGKICASQEPLILTLEENLQWTCTGKYDAMQRTNSDELILNLLDQKTGMKWSELEKESDKGKSSLKLIIDRLIEDKLIYKGDDGLWYKK
ncbi:MAG: AAA family ATPase [Candidatus Zhuqueibacterota bacterium]